MILISTTAVLLSGLPVGCPVVSTPVVSLFFQDILNCIGYAQSKQMAGFFSQ